jgi:hypothetical protein
VTSIPLSSPLHHFVMLFSAYFNLGLPRFESYKFLFLSLIIFLCRKLEADCDVSLLPLIPVFTFTTRRSFRPVDRKL